MADLIQIKRGDTTGVSFLADGELGYSRAEKALYIGDGGRRNQKLCSAETIAKVEELSELPEESDLSAVITAYNALLSALKTSEVV